MKLRQLPLDQVKVPDIRVTATYDEEHLKLLKDSLAAMGTVNPVIVAQDGDHFLLIDGLHRLQEARARGEKTIPAVVYEGGPGEALLMNLVLNRVRGKVRASEMVQVIASLWKDHGMDSEAIGAKTGLGRDYIEKLQRISQAAPSVQEALEKEIIGVGAAYEIARLPHHLQQEELMAKYQIWRFTAKELHDFVGKVLQEMEGLQAQVAQAPAAQPRAPETYACEGCKAEVPARYLRPVMVCPDCFGQVWRLARGKAEAPAPAGDGPRPG